MGSCKNLLFVLYDGIENSVFHSMVLQPLVRRMVVEQDLHVTLVSFQSKRVDEKCIGQLTENNSRLRIIIVKKFVPWGNVGLGWYGLILALSLNRDYNEIIARGPLAGLIALKACMWKRFFSKHFGPSTTIQARGLCGEEYRYAKQQIGKFGLLQRARYWLLARKEKRAYQLAEKMSKKVGNISIESVSEALKTYISNTFHVSPLLVTIAKKDAITPATHDDINSWRQKMRADLGIKPDAYVYCYSGSYKPWQCVDQTIDFFKKQFEQNKNAFLVIYSADKQAFEKHLMRVGLDNRCWLVLSVPAAQLLMHLAVADAGILLREPDVINWVSRPTKMLEYQTVGLKIIHNNTVGCLAGRDF